MRKVLSFLIVLCINMTACHERELAPLVESDHKPGVVSNVKVENLPGGAKISYTLPDDVDLLYVIAEFQTQNNQQRVVKSSVYKNFVLLEGLVTTGDQEVVLYAVNRGENRSDPVSTIITPLTAPIETVYETLAVKSDFGGVNLKFTNEEQNEYVLYTMIKDSVGEWTLYDRLYTSAKEWDYGVRGLPAEETEFAFYFMDRWLNYSDTLYGTYTPLYEEELNKELWRHSPLDNDYFEPLYTQHPVSRLWSGTTQNYFFLKPYEGIDFPLWVTIDLGQRAIFSRMRVNQVSHNNNTGWLFTNGSPRTYEVWASNDPASDGSWESWTKVGDFESIKPSGYPLGQLSNEDMALARHGEDFNFPLMNESYRYIRFKVTSTWGNNPIIRISELTFWGQPEQ